MKELAKALLIVALLQVFSATGVADDADDVLVRADTKTVQAICRNWHVKILEGDLDLNLFRLSVPRGMSADEFATRLGPVASPNDSVELPDASPHPLLQQSTVALLDSAATTQLAQVGQSPLVFYYGSNVRQGYLEQTAAELTRVLKAHGASTGATVTVAVIDTGVDIFHPALMGALTPGYNFIQDSSDVTEAPLLQQSTVALLDGGANGLVPVQVNQSTVALLDQSTVALLDGIAVPPAYGHGTAVAGIIRLVAPNSLIMPLKAFGPDGRGEIYDIARAIRYAVERGARVINMSFSLPEDNKELNAAIEFAKSRGVFCASSTGNEGADLTVYPAKYAPVTGVTATDMKDVAAPFTNFGQSADVAAPGLGVITTFPGGTYALVSGTSFSTPFLSSGGALVISAKPSLDQSAVANMLETTGAAIDKLNPDRHLGKTRVDFVNALQLTARQ